MDQPIFLPEKLCRSGGGGKSFKVEICRGQISFLFDPVRRVHRRGAADFPGGRLFCFFRPEDSFLFITTFLILCLRGKNAVFDRGGGLLAAGEAATIIAMSKQKVYNL